ncbi:PLP-dependent transferase [archaeon]|nr:MAG: PLP-dependent transferase [archaeon]
MAGCHQSDPLTGAVTPPLHFSTTFERDENLTLSRGFNYSRIGNPTRKLFEDAMAAIERGSSAHAFASGMQAAMSVFISFPHAHVMVSDDNYHGVVVLLTDVFSKWGVTFEKVDMTNHNAVKERLDAFHKDSAASHRPLLFWMETPTNPKCKVVDIAKLSKLVKSTIGEENSFVVVDATWSTPYLVRPLTLGADCVLHSGTKYIGGHSDCMGGVLVLGSSPAVSKVSPMLHTVHHDGGGVLSPFDSWLLLRGLRTLPVRMKAHCTNAMAVAEYLQGHKAIKKVYYPGLLIHPQHKLASEMMGEMYGGMLSFTVKAEDSKLEETAMKVVKHVKLFKKATSLGGTESLIEHRASVEGKYGATPKNLLRVSVGLEDIGDLIADLDSALEAATGK